MGEPAKASALTIKRAAKILGVSEQTLRRWDNSGKFRARRHPINGYRLYKQQQLAELQKLIRAGDEE